MIGLDEKTPKNIFVLSVRVGTQWKYLNNYSHIREFFYQQKNVLAQNCILIKPHTDVPVLSQFIVLLNIHQRAQSRRENSSRIFFRFWTKFACDYIEMLCSNALALK